MKRFPCFLVALIFVLLSIGRLLAVEPLNQSINFLLDHVARSHATFIRNGQSYTPEEAVNHIKAKYEHFKSAIKTPEDFIRLAASKSLLSGQPYRVRTADGKEMDLDAWLTAALKAHQSESTR